MLVGGPREPGSTLQMKAHRYGALPIGLRRAAFADTVVDLDAQLETGNGLVYEEPADEALLAALQRAVGAYAKRRAFEQVRVRAMRIDHSWERSAHLHERAYRA